MTIYLGIAFLVGIIAGAIHNLILFRHVIPYMKFRGLALPQGMLAGVQVNKILAEYHKTDDPSQKKIKILLRCSRLLFFVVWLIVAFVIFIVWKESVR